MQSTQMGSNLLGIQQTVNSTLISSEYSDPSLFNLIDVNTCLWEASSFWTSVSCEQLHLHLMSNKTMNIFGHTDSGCCFQLTQLDLFCSQIQIIHQALHLFCVFLDPATHASIRLTCGLNQESYLERGTGSFNIVGQDRCAVFMNRVELTKHRKRGRLH